MVQKLNVSIFDRVTEIEFHRETEVSDFDLTVFPELAKVSKPLNRIQVDTANWSPLDVSQKFTEEMERQVSIQVEAALGQSFSKCQIANVEQVGPVWQAEIKPDVFTCKSIPSEE